MVGVSWFEAEAYCRWLALEAGLDPDAPDAHRLPTEEEWERAVRGTDGRAYPWGADWGRARLNSAEWWAGREFADDKDRDKWGESEAYEEANPSPTTVVTFPEGVNSLGLWDGVGNVWEWTNSWYSKGDDWRTIRGGSWGSDQSSARCAFRSGDHPDLFSNRYGFRVVRPGSPPSEF